MKSFFTIIAGLLLPLSVFSAGLTLPQGGLGTTTVPTGYFLKGLNTIRVTAVSLFGDQNTWTAHNIFDTLFATNASTTNATTTALTVTGRSLFNTANFSGAVTGISLDEIENPSTDKTFTLAANNLTFNMTTPSSVVEFNATGAFSDHAVHIHQLTGNPGAGTQLLHLHAEDADVIGLEIDQASASTSPALHIQSGRALLNGGNVGVGTSSPYQELSVNGDLALTGGIYDPGASLGSLGNLLSSTGSAIDWIATSTLKINSGDVIETSNLFYTTARVNTDAPNVTLAGQNYLSLSGQQITAGQITLSGSHVTGVLPSANVSTSTLNILHSNLKDLVWANSGHTGTNFNLAGFTSAGAATNYATSSLKVLHSDVTGLTVDGHTQYALLAGRSGGQTLIGGTATTDDLILRSTSGAGATGALILFQVGNNGATEAMRILNDGAILVGGATSAGASLLGAGGQTFQVYKPGGGDSYFQFYSSDGTKKIEFATNASESFIAYDAAKLSLYNSTAARVLSLTSVVTFPTVGTESGNDNYACLDPTTHEITDGGVNCGASSERYKTNIKDVPLTLDKVMQLHPILYNWKTSAHPDRNQRIGFRAEEIYKVIPQVVTLDKTGKPDSVNYDDVVPVLAGAIQELNALHLQDVARIAELESRMKAVDGKEATPPVPVKSSIPWAEIMGATALLASGGALLKKKKV